MSCGGFFPKRGVLGSFFVELRFHLHNYFFSHNILRGTHNTILSIIIVTFQPYGNFAPFIPCRTCERMSWRHVNHRTATPHPAHVAAIKARGRYHPMILLHGMRRSFKFKNLRMGALFSPSNTGLKNTLVKLKKSICF